MKPFSNEYKLAVVVGSHSPPIFEVLNMTPKPRTPPQERDELLTLSVLCHPLKFNSSVRECVRSFVPNTYNQAALHMLVAHLWLRVCVCVSVWCFLGQTVSQCDRGASERANGFCLHALSLWPMPQTALPLTRTVKKKASSLALPKSVLHPCSTFLTTSIHSFCTLTGRACKL